MSSAVGASVGNASSHSTVTFCGTLANVGAVESSTVTVLETVVSLPQLSVANFHSHDAPSELDVLLTLLVLRKIVSSHLISGNLIELHVPLRLLISQKEITDIDGMCSLP